MPLGETISYVFAIFSVIVICVLFPYSFCRIFFADKLVLLADESFIRTYGMLYEDIKVAKKASRLFYMVFVIRRVIYLLLALVLT